MAQDKKELFSKEALAKLRSPERIDALLQVTTPVSWMSLAALGMIVFSIMMWSVFGAIVEKVEGVGILLDAAGVVNVASVSGGRVDKIMVNTGMRVRRGDVIAMLELPSQEIESKQARSDMYLAENEREAVTRAAMYDAKRYQQNVSEVITSGYDGIVDEVAVMPESIIAAGGTICTIRREEGRDELYGVLYVPAQQGKKIQPGMTLQLSPNGSSAEEEGSIIAVVRSASRYPVSAAAMLKRLGNEQIVQWLLNKNDYAVTEISFELVKDEKDSTGYLWTSSVGRHRAVTSGSVCSGFVVVDRKPPIEKVFYKISQWLRSR